MSGLGTLPLGGPVCALGRKRPRNRQWPKGTMLTRALEGAGDIEVDSFGPGKIGMELVLHRLAR